jgi:predicted phage-related endonuclease
VNADDAQKAYPSGSGGVELPGLTDHVERLVRLRQDAKELEVEIDALQTQIMSEMQDAEEAAIGSYRVIWPIRKYKATEERVVPAKEAREVRLKTLQIKQ